MPSVPDWLAHLKLHVAEQADELDLTVLRPGDVIRVVTLHTCYDMLIIEGRDAELRTDRPDRPNGRVRMMGCTFGQSTTIKPDSLFCGGNLEFTFEDGKMTHTTTAIRALHWVRSERPVS